MESGFWTPHSSSVDFCEPNYVLSNYIAEPFNSISSLFIFYLGCIGLRYSNPTHEARFSCMYIILMLIGLGSTALHCTLSWLPQSSDEVKCIIEALSYFNCNCNFTLGSDVMDEYLHLIFTNIQ